MGKIPRGVVWDRGEHTRESQKILPCDVSLHLPIPFIQEISAIDSPTASELGEELCFRIQSLAFRINWVCESLWNNYHSLLSELEMSEGKGLRFYGGRGEHTREKDLSSDPPYVCVLD